MKRLQPWVAMLVVLAGGMLFGYGLALSTMISPEVVLGFLTGNDYGLTLVMGGAVAITLVCYQLAPRWMDSPVMDKQFMLREAKLDRDTVLGSVIFGRLGAVRRVSWPGHCWPGRRQYGHAVGTDRYFCGRLPARLVGQPQIGRLTPTKTISPKAAASKTRG